MQEAGWQSASKEYCTCVRVKIFQHPLVKLCPRTYRPRTRPEDLHAQEIWRGLWKVCPGQPGLVLVSVLAPLPAMDPSLHRAAEVDGFSGFSSPSPYCHAFYQSVCVWVQANACKCGFLRKGWRKVLLFCYFYQYLKIVFMFYPVQHFGLFFLLKSAV